MNKKKCAVIGGVSTVIIALLSFFGVPAPVIGLVTTITGAAQVSCDKIAEEE